MYNNTLTWKVSVRVSRMRRHLNACYITSNLGTSVLNYCNGRHGHLYRATAIAIGGLRRRDRRTSASADRTIDESDFIVLIFLEWQSVLQWLISSFLLCYIAPYIGGYEDGADDTRASSD